jgi:hypothetical protein
MITEEIYLQLLESAARACGEGDRDEAIKILTTGGIPFIDAREKVTAMIEAGPAIRRHQEQERELIRLRDQVPDGRRCIVVTTNGATPERASQEAQHIWRTVVREALADSVFTDGAAFCQGMDPTPLALQAVGKANLFIFILSDQATQLGWLQSQAQTLGKPIVPLAADGRELRLALPLLSEPIYYTCQQRGDRFEVKDSNDLVDRLRRRIREPQASQAAARYEVTRQIYRGPLRMVGAQSVRETIYPEKLRSLHELHLSLQDARKRMDDDYELASAVSISTLAPFAEILTEAAAMYQSNYQCLHKAMRKAVGALPKAQQDESLKVCDSMKELLQRMGDLIRDLQTAAPVVLLPGGRNAAIETIQAEIRACCGLIPDREALVKSMELEWEDPLGSMEVVVKENAVKIAFDRAVQRESSENIKDFCRAIRSALLRWLAFDRCTPGAFDGAAARIEGYGAQLHERLVASSRIEQTDKVQEAILQHVTGFNERRKLSREQRAVQDYEALVRFVQVCGE